MMNNESENKSTPENDQNKQHVCAARAIPIQRGLDFLWGAKSIDRSTITIAQSFKVASGRNAKRAVTSGTFASLHNHFSPLA
jgi:hypothetical protein